MTSIAQEDTRRGLKEGKEVTDRGARANGPIYTYLPNLRFTFRCLNCKLLHVSLPSRGRHPFIGPRFGPPSTALFKIPPFAPSTGYKSTPLLGRPRIFR